MADRLRQFKMPVRDFNVSEQQVLDKRRYADTRSMLYDKMKTWFFGKNVRIYDSPDLVSELCLPQYEFLPGSNRLQVESKKKLKARGKRSPDLADSFMLTFAEDQAMLGYDTEPGAHDWAQPISRNLPVV